MPRKHTRTAVDKYLAELNKDPKSASYRKRKANLGLAGESQSHLPSEARSY